MNPEIVRKYGLHAYQQQIADFILKTPRNALFLPVGAGKTRIVLAALEQLKPKCHILVVAPAPIAKISWKEEIEETGADIPYISLTTGPRGGKLAKQKRWQKYEDIKYMPPSLYTIGRELVPDIVDYFKNKKEPWPFPIIIVDELQSFKSNSSSRFAALKSIIKQTYRFTGLTGTPAPNGLMDLWSQIFLIDGGLRLGRSITAYRQTFFNEGRYINGYCVEWFPKPVMPLLDTNKNPVRQNGEIVLSGISAKQMIYRLISDIVISADISPYIKLPEKMEAVHKIEMDPDEKEIYTKMMKEHVLEIAGSPDAVTAENAAALTQKLTQMASGNLYINENHDSVKIHDKKLDMLEYIVQNEPAPILVAYYFQTDKAAIMQRIPEAVPFKGEPALKEKWDKGEIHVMLIHPASVGFGLNLQHGGHTLVWYTLSWSLEHYIQTNGRLYRQGQTDSVVIHHLITKDTIDEQIMKVLQGKEITQSQLIDAVSITLAPYTKTP